MAGLGLDLVSKSDQSTGNYAHASYALQSGDIRMIFTAPYKSKSSAHENAALPNFEAEKAVDFLENLGCVAYKIASPEINHFPLLKKVAETKKPIIISSGVSYLKDITDAVNYLKKNGCNKICILKCDSNYPSSLKVSNLSSIQYLKKKFGVPVGFSDHTIGNEAALISILFGACLVEKHFNIKRNKSLDDFFSSNEDEFKNMVNSIRILENDIKKNKYFISNTAISNRSSMRSIYISKNVKKNEIVTNENIRIVRPGFGMHPKFYFKVLGKRFKKKYNYGDRLSKDKLK
jgi:sialic acid synthase SpsE